MIVKWLLPYVQFIVWYCIFLDRLCMVFLLIWMIVAGMILAFLLELNFFFWLISYIKFIDWFFTCLDLFISSFHLNYCSTYVIGYFARRYFFVWFWKVYYLISSSSIDSLLRIDFFFWLQIGYYLVFSSFIDSLLALICMVFLSIWIIVVGMFVVVFTRNYFFVYFWHGFYFLSS